MRVHVVSDPHIDLQYKAFYDGRSIKRSYISGSGLSKVNVFFSLSLFFTSRMCRFSSINSTVGNIIHRASHKITECSGRR